ncbi:MAG: hypothetical protein QOF70_779 [Acetobacteraceae bacterium]|jgi:enoyl-CoA hydratase|nr:hypothetical protein [Acetobacteraceae bacterium]
METSNQVEVSVDDRLKGRVETVPICNCRRHNIMNTALMGEFIDAIGLMSADERLRAVILTGKGERAFVVGADIKEMAIIRAPAEARNGPVRHA